MPIGSMEVYKRETRKVIKCFLGHKVSFPDCIAALDAAHAGLILGRLRPEELDALRALLLANNETVMKEMERRGTPDEKAK